MTEMVISRHENLPADRIHLGPQPIHILGRVADDWAAIDVWLGTVDDNSRSQSGQTVATYRYHLAKVRWYCERHLGYPPSYWNVQDIKAFKSYLADLPPSALPGVFTASGEPVPTPFLKQPSGSSQADIMRFVKAMFKALYSSGYLKFNPMAFMKVTKERRIDAKRAVPDDLFELVLQLIEEAPKTTPKQRQLRLRDRFIFVCLRESGLRASELVGAHMDAFHTVYSPKRKTDYWALSVTAETAKGGKARNVPVTTVLLDALIEYRTAFGLGPYPELDRIKYGLVLSVRTDPKGKSLGGMTVEAAADRRFLGAWRNVTTRQGLYEIVKGRVRDAVELLKQAGDLGAAKNLEKVSSHWLRHTFALAQIAQGRDMRTVASSLGHASIDTTMDYTEQDALDQIEVWERDSPGCVALATQMKDV